MKNTLLAGIGLPKPVVLPLLLVRTLVSPLSVDAQRTRVDTLPLLHHVTGNQLPLKAGSLASLTIDQSFTYVGGQRFVLLGVADAEQHLFVMADSSGSVRRLYWVQIEGYLPNRAGSYDYSADSAVTIQGIQFRTNVYASAGTGPARVGSDREWMLALLARHGYHLADGSTRLRLIYVPDATVRREIMIVYLEPGTELAGERDASATLFSRATSGLKLAK